MKFHPSSVPAAATALAAAALVLSPTSVLAFQPPAAAVTVARPFLSSSPRRIMAHGDDGEPSPSPSPSMAAATASAVAGDEIALRDEIAGRASLVEDEGKYGATDVAGTAVLVEVVEEIVEEETNTNTNTNDSSPLAQKIRRMSKERAYPLFLAEKAASIIEDAWDGLLDAVGSDMVDLEQYTAAANNGADAAKERIVVLGTGWGAAAFLKDVDADAYDVTVISPRNFFLFTPMLAGAAVGTVDYRSITEPVREINRKANYLEATATDIDPTSKTVTCDSVVCEGNSCIIESFSLPYDHLIVTVGAQTNTFGIPGVRENCCFLKQVEDAQRIRNTIINCFERANLPSNDDEKKERILTFAVIGAGPTGVEFASELRDFIESDGGKYYGELLKHVRIKVIEASSTVLMPFDKSLQREAIKQLTRAVEIKNPFVASLVPGDFQLTELLLESGVGEVKEDVIVLNNGREIPYGMAVWAAGNGPLPLTLNLIDALEGTEQESVQAVARGRLGVDPWLRVLGGDGSLLALGDCTCIEGGTGQLPATAQVAAQQGEYLARLLSRNADLRNTCSDTDAENSNSNSNSMVPPRLDPARERTPSESIAAFAMNDDGAKYAAPFQFLNLGILAYTGGGSALAQLQFAPDEKARVKSKGKIGFGLWRSVYLSKQVSARNRVLVFTDWLKTRVFGRDITRL